MDFTGKVVVVTGSAGGIGRGVAEAFANTGATVWVLDINPDAASTAAKDITDKGLKAFSSSLDVTNEKQVNELMDKVVQQCGQIDILVNSAGIACHLMMEDLTVDQFRRVVDVNLTGTFICTQAAARHMKARSYGKIINIISTAATRISFAAGPEYTASKYAVKGLTKHLGYELAAYGINVNGISPGPVASEMYMKHADPGELKKRTELIPAGRLMTPQDIADASFFLASDAAAMVSGNVIDVDGGSVLGWISHERYVENRKSKIGKKQGS